MKMIEAFYIVQVKEDWYRLHVTSTHYCLGAGCSLAPLLQTIKRLTKECRNEEGLLKRLSKLTDKGHVNKLTRTIYEKDYKRLSHYFKQVVEKTVREAKEESKYDTLFHRTMRRSLRNDIFSTPVVIENRVKITGDINE